MILSAFSDDELNHLIEVLIRRKQSGWVSATLKKIFDTFVKGEDYFIFKGYYAGDTPGGKGSKTAVEDLLGTLIDINFIIPEKKSFVKVTPKVPAGLSRWQEPEWKGKRTNYYEKEEDIPIDPIDGITGHNRYTFRNVKKTAYMFIANLPEEEQSRLKQMHGALRHLKTFDLF
jgi:hypothetical protein